MHKLKICTLIVAVVAFLIGCKQQDNRTNLIKSNELSGGSVESIDIKEYELKFAHNDKIIKIKSSDIPIVNQYLNESDDPESEIRWMSLDYIGKVKDNTYFLLKYGRAIKLRDYVLIKFRRNTFNSSITLAFGIYQEHKYSLDNKYLAFNFRYNQGNTVLRNDIVVIDLLEMKKCILTNVQEKYQPFLWWISDYKWVGDKKIEISIPNIKEFDFESLEKWGLSEDRESRVIEFLVD
ncbi:hypothetical protein PV797_19460 [Clostridiaceae bacterium M8S5]|nr:hypothetical protein PV797_19460 [Clostridiaceae bacterium M8S5]